ncbi:MAG TPA: EcsC family protein [Thermoanaerobaculia bacterium]|nr:EcsC family protein [Thermoanaerobaculia bacterium]
MVKVRELKRRADTVLEEVFRSLFEEIDMDKVRAEVAAIRAGAPETERIEHARQLSRRTAIRCAAAGAVTGLPSGVFAIGALGADLSYLMFQQFRLIVAIATMYGHEPNGRERFTEAMSCLAYASGVGIGKHGIGTLLESATVEGGVIAEKIGTRFVRERLAKAIPFVGALSGGALNYWSVRAVGRAAVRYYESRVEESLAEEIWAEGDREHA